MEDPTVKRERPTIPARRFVRPRSVSPAATIEAVLRVNEGLKSHAGHPGSVASPASSAQRTAVHGCGSPVAAIEVDEGELIEIPPQSDVRHLHEELLSESGTWAIERTDESCAEHDRADGREHVR